MKLLAAAPSQEEQIVYAKSLRNLKTGWTSAQRKAYFEWFQKGAAFKGGQRFQQYLTEIKQAATATLTAKERDPSSVSAHTVTTSPAAVNGSMPRAQRST